jgi:hypothetical protein
MISVSVRGDDRVGRGLRALAGKLRDLTEAWRPVGAAMVEAATPLTPVLTGALVDSLKVKESRDGLVMTAGGGSVDYAAVQNYGSAVRNIEAKRFMEPAYAYAEREAAHEIETVLTATARINGL